MTLVMLVLWTFLLTGAMFMTWDQGELNRLLLLWFLGVAALLLVRSILKGVSRE